MSQLSEFFRHKGYILETVVDYLKDHAINLTGEEKAKVVLDVMKALHISSGGIWGAMFKQAVLIAIDYELARLDRHAEHPLVPPSTSAPSASIYDVWEDGVLPSDEELLKRGFASGSFKWTRTEPSVQWTVGHKGGLVGGAAYAGPIGG